MVDNAAISPDYAVWLGEVKTRIRSARLSAARSVNRELIGLYCQGNDQEIGSSGMRKTGRKSRDLGKQQPK